MFEVVPPPELSLTCLSEQQDTVLSHTSIINNTVPLFSLLLSYHTGQSCSFFVSLNGQIINRLGCLCMYIYIFLNVSDTEQLCGWIGTKLNNVTTYNKIMWNTKYIRLCVCMHTIDPMRGNNQMCHNNWRKKNLFTDTSSQWYLMSAKKISYNSGKQSFYLLLINLYIWIHRENELSHWSWLSSYLIFFISPQEATTTNFF